MTLIHTGDETKVISMGLVDAPLTTKIWLTLIRPEPWHQDWRDYISIRATDATRHFTRPVKLTNGTHTFGGLTLAERRLIRPSFAEMMGVSAPVRRI